ncbi:hypothetical protein QQ054_23830 [Oscillatoria amoena NRMC-F 0135]|nr:hypothetical protein [Oscillatoria amoena NRMC-F 0135]
MWWQVFTSVAILLLNIAICIRLYGELIDYRRSNIAVLGLSLLLFLLSIFDVSTANFYVERAVAIVLLSLSIFVYYVMFKLWLLLIKPIVFDWNKALFKKYSTKEKPTRYFNVLEWVVVLWVKRLPVFMVFLITGVQLILIRDFNAFSETGKALF